MLIQEFFTKISKINPSKKAVVFDNDSITYEELDKKTNILSNHLISVGLKKSEKVIIYIPKSVELFISFISVLKSDAVYVPLNTKAPFDRNHEICKELKPTIILCNNDTFESALEIKNSLKNKIKVINVDNKFDGSSKIISYENKPHDIAYILFTSGSTGKPKGVMITHDNIINYSKWCIDFFKIIPDDKFTNFPGLFFDLSVFDIYPSLLAGSTIVVVPDNLLLFPLKLFNYLQIHKVTIWNSVPSLYSYISNICDLTKIKINSIRLFTFNGEIMQVKTLKNWMSAYEDCRFVNQYGPTEATCATLFFEVKDIPIILEESIPIGKPINGAEVFILDEYGKLISNSSEIGELYIGGKGVAIGYFNDSQKTNSSFIKNPIDKFDENMFYKTGDLVQRLDNGNYVYIGRKDNQIKFMGYRVELGEIDCKLQSLTNVKNSATIFTKKKDWRESQIVSFIVLNQKYSTSSIRNSLVKILPIYMIPKKFIILSDLPLNQNGKVDRNRLKDLYLNDKL